MGQRKGSEWTDVQSYLRSVSEKTGDVLGTTFCVDSSHVSRSQVKNESGFSEDAAFSTICVHKRSSCVRFSVIKELET